jgi:hypothetical protein
MGNRKLRYIKVEFIDDADETKNSDASFTFDGIQWDFGGKLFPKDIKFLNALVELVKQHNG